MIRCQQLDWNIRKTFDSVILSIPINFFDSSQSLYNLFTPTFKLRLNRRQKKQNAFTDELTCERFSVHAYTALHWQVAKYISLTVPRSVGPVLKVINALRASKRI